MKPTGKHRTRRSLAKSRRTRFETLEERRLLSIGCDELQLADGASKAGYLFEFSLDIGSDVELSDPANDGNEAFDPGDVYLWQSGPMKLPGRDGFKDDLGIFIDQDPYPDPPDRANPPTTAVPVGSGGIQDYQRYFDLDGHDQLDVSLIDRIPDGPLRQPIPRFESLGIFDTEFLAVSFDDDTAMGWPRGDVPVTRPSPAGITYGNSAARDEIVGVTLTPGEIPASVTSLYAIADEITVHGSLAPNPGDNQQDDDDVDSLDVVENVDTCPVWFFSADHEANMGLDPGDVYEVKPDAGPVRVIDDEIHLGLTDNPRTDVVEDADVDAFEFVWMEDAAGAGASLAVVFSVDDDDALTAVDESGGLDPNMLYASLLTGSSFELLKQPLEDDVDGLTNWHEEMRQEERDLDCDAGGPYFAEEGSLVTLDGSRSIPAQPDVPIVSYEWDINGDGITDLTGQRVDHVWPDDGEYVVRLTVTDERGAGDAAEATVEVANVAPVVTVAADATYEMGETFTLTVASFSDAGVEDTHTATIDWGDGTIEPGTVREPKGDGTVIATHVYVFPGNHLVTVAVTDNHGDACVDEFTITATPMDFGDAPAPYPTMRPDGARHRLIENGPSLGFLVDVEDNGQPVPPGAGDDLDGGDDEDGTWLSSTMTLGDDFDVFANEGWPGYLNLWIDFNCDGDWDDSGEHFIDDYWLAFETSPIWLTEPVPSTAAAGVTYARFRISSVEGLSYDGPAPDGEVEDHRVEILSTNKDGLEPNNGLQQAVDLGYFGQTRSNLGLHAAGDEDWYEWNALNDGTLTVNALFSHGAGNLELELYDDSGVLLASSTSSTDNEQITWDVDGEKSYYAHVFSADDAAHPDYTLELTTSAESENYAVLFSGGIGAGMNRSRYYEHTRELYLILTQLYGLDPDNIWVLHADGNDPGLDQNDPNFGYRNSDMSFAANVLQGTPDNLEMVLTDTMASQVDDNDHFFVWSFDHGDGMYKQPGTMGEEALCGWGSDVSDEDLADWLNQVPAGHRTMVMSQCFAGGMLDNLMPVDSTTYGCAATNHYERSWEGAFASAFNDALRIHTNGHDAYRYAYLHDGYATDGEGPEGTTIWRVEHPWEASDTSFPIFAEQENNPPELLDIREVKWVAPWDKVKISFEELRAAVEAEDPEGKAINFRVESVEFGTLLIDGQQVVPGETSLGYGQVVEWTPPEGGLPAKGEIIEPFTIRAYDGATVSDGRLAVPLRRYEAGDLPEAVDDTAVVDEDAQNVPIPVLDNDLGQRELSVVSVGPALHGTTHLVDGRVLYSPAAEFSGSDGFTYFIADANGDTDSARVNVRVSAVNDPPEAYQDKFTVAPNSADNLIDVLLNDSDAESKPLGDSPPYLISATVTDSPLHGTLTGNADGTFNYTPDPGHFGLDRFLYRADDGQDSSQLTTVTITVGGLSRHPGDANLDGRTDVRDFNIWNAHKFTGGTNWTTGDFNHDGLTDVRDFNIWNAHKFTSALDPTPTDAAFTEESDELKSPSGVLAGLLEIVQQDGSRHSSERTSRTAAAVDKLLASYWP